MPINIAVRYYCSETTKLKIKIKTEEMGNTMYWQGCRGLQTLLCSLWERKSVQLISRKTGSMDANIYEAEPVNTLRSQQFQAWYTPNKSAHRRSPKDMCRTAAP